MYKKKILFYTSSLFISLFLIFFISYLALVKGTFLLDQDHVSVKNSLNIIKNIETLNFYKNNSLIVNHLRSIHYKNQLNDLIFTEIKYSPRKPTILFQGDSWMAWIAKSKKATTYLKNNFNDDFNIINGGTSSYSPSLLSTQFSLLKDNFNIQPDYVIAYIDQTDIGDESCRYKLLKKFNLANELVGVPYEEYPLYKDPFNLDTIIKLNEILLSESSLIFKNIQYLNFKIKKTFTRVNKTIKHKFYKQDFPKKCFHTKILRPLYSNNNDIEIKYFEETIDEYFNKLKKDAYIKKVFIVTHPHKNHFFGKKYNIDVSNIIKKKLKDYPNFYHINFSEKISKDVNFHPDLENSWRDGGHLADEQFVNIFLKEIVNQFNLFYNK